MKTFTWTVSAMDCKVSEDGLSNVIQTIHWRYKLTDEDYSAEIYGAQKMPSPNPKSFTPYEEVTLSMVTEWLESEMDMDKIKENLINQIELEKNPIIVTLPLFNIPTK